MAARISGVTRASSLGPISEFMERHGGSIARVLRDVDLPFALLEQPEIIVPLREQFRLLERAARETGDAYFGAPWAGREQSWAQCLRSVGLFRGYVAQRHEARRGRSGTHAADLDQPLRRA